jgi:hypothetical protein
MVTLGPSATPAVHQAMVAQVTPPPVLLMVPGPLVPPVTAGAQVSGALLPQPMRFIVYDCV